MVRVFGDLLIGVEGNEEVDKLAKSALRKEEIDIEIPLEQK